MTNRIILSLTLLIILSLFISQPTLAATSLEIIKLRACQSQETQMRADFVNIINLSENMSQKLDIISSKIMAVYNSLPPAKKAQLTQVSQIAQAIQAKRTNLANLITNAKSQAALISCTGSNPTGQVNILENQMKQIFSLLKDYKTSLKNLISFLSQLQPQPSGLPSASASATTRP